MAAYGGRLLIVISSLLLSGCAGVAVGPTLAVGAVAAGYYVVSSAAAGAVNKGVVNHRTGSVLLDSVTWSSLRGDSTTLLARGVLTWKKAKSGPNKTTFLNIGGAPYSGEAAATGLFQIDLLDTKGKLLITMAPAAVTVWDSGKAIQFIPADRSLPFELRTTSVPWNVLRDAKEKRLRYQVTFR